MKLKLRMRKRGVAIYKIALERPYIVRDLIKDILSNKFKYGVIYFGGRLLSSYEYNNGGLSRSVPPPILDSTVSSATMSSVKRRVDYFLIIDNIGE